MTRFPLQAAAHREAVLKHLGPDEAVFLWASPHPLRNGDTEYRYRPDSDLYWLTGWVQPEAAIFLRPGDEPFTLFCQPRDRQREVWTGRRPGPEGARKHFGADAAFPIGSIEAELPRLLAGVSTLHCVLGKDPDHDQILRAAIATAERAARQTGLEVPETFIAPSKLLHELRLVKSEGEIAIMRRAAEVTAHAHIAAMAAAAPGVHEFEIEALIEGTFRRCGGTGPGYPSIVAGGDNANILHYIDNDAPLAAGQLLLVDAGCEVDWYTADVTRTYPVDGRFTEPQRRVYQAVLDAQLAAIDEARAGRPFTAMHQTATRHLTQAMIDLGLLEGDIDVLIANEDHKRYYMHGTGHWLGLDVHDAGRYIRGGGSRPLEPGMVVTVEPGLYIPADDTDAPEDLRGIGVRIEDDVLVTDGDPVVLTASIPKTVDEVEEACGGQA